MKVQNKTTSNLHSGTSEMYQFIDFHSVTTSSQNAGSSLDNLLYALKPTEHGWESARFSSFPQEVIFKLHARTKLEYVLIASKKSLGAKHVQILMGDGLSGSFMDVNYQMAGEVKALSNVPVKVKCYGIGSFIKLVFKDEPERTQANPYGQVSLSLFRVWGMPISYYKGIKFEGPAKNKLTKEKTDKILVELGLPIDLIEWSHSDSDSYKYTPVDEDTRETLAGLEQIYDQALKAEDYPRAGNLSRDIKRLIEIGTKVLTLRRELAEVVAKEDFGRAIGIKEQLVKLERTRDNIDVFYETPRYERIIVMQGPSTAALKLQEQLEEEEKARAKAEELRRLEEQRLKELEEKRLLELEERRRSQLLEEEMERKRLEEEEARAKAKEEEEAELERIREEEARREEERKEEERRKEEKRKEEKRKEEKREEEKREEERREEERREEERREEERKEEERKEEERKEKERREKERREEEKGEEKEEEEKGEDIAKSLRESKIGRSSERYVEENIITEETKQEVKKSTPRRSKPAKKEVKKPRVEEQQIKEHYVKGRNVRIEPTTGDAELEVYLIPLLNAAGGPVKDLNEDSHIPKDTLEVCGVKMWNALHSESWRHREAAGTAFLQYLEAPLVLSYNYYRLHDSTAKLGSCLRLQWK